MADTPENDTAVETPVEEEAVRLNLDVNIDTRGACQRHITVTVPREDIERYYGKTFDELMTTAQVPGFRAGHVPRKLVEHRFRKEVKDQIKSNLVLDSLSQISEENELAAISEPDLDLEAVDLPDDGNMTFEFNIEVRPEFDVPDWKGLAIEKPVKEFTDDDVTARIQSVLADDAKFVKHDGKAEQGDAVLVNVAVKHGDKDLGHRVKQTLRLQPKLSFRDAQLEGFDKLLIGSKAGDKKTAKVKISEESSNEELKGQEVEAEFEVLEVQKVELPELTPELLKDLGGFESEAEMREAVLDSLNRRVEYEQQQRARQQVLAALTASADWELPPDLLRRQSHRELERAVLELQRSGFSEQEIRAHEATIRQNSLTRTEKALKEHFVLEKIAEEEKVEDTPADYDLEIALIAANSGQSARRVRAQLEKTGQMDYLRNQIIERKVLSMIQDQAKFKEVPFTLEAQDVETIDWAIGGETEPEIPTAKHDEQAELSEPPQHD